VSAIPARLGRYRLLEHLASGGMADVFRAKSVGIAGFEKILAIKLIRPHIAQEPRFIRSFIDEARIAVSLNHRNIVQVFDFGKAEHRLFLAMELIEGIDLKTALGAARTAGYEIPLPIACYIIADVGAGLDYAHRKADAEGKSLGIVHCDVSPHNVMLSDEGFIKILDFGVARASFAVTPEERRLRGKPRYMAPEQTRGEVPGPASDAFALGIVAWELFTGLPLFEGDDLAAVLAAVRRADVPPVRRLNPDVPAYLSDAISAALAVSPADRISAADLSDTAARAARELASVASSRALADWLALVKPGAELDEEPTEPPADSEDSVLHTASTAEVLGEQDRDRPQTRTNIIVASDLSSESRDRPGEEPAAITRDVDAVSAQGPDPTAPPSPVPATGSGDLARPIAEKLLRERRHVVATCAYIDGGDPALRDEIARLLAELAYKRGAVVQDQSAESVTCVFGLEVAGEDDVANAMHYCIDASELAREAGPRGLSLRLGTRSGIVAQRRGDAIHVRGSGLDDARALARDAEPGRPLLSGGAGRLASAQFAFRELPVRRHRSRRLRAFELVGPRSFEQRARVLTERRGRFVGRGRELATLDELLATAIDEDRRVLVALVGPGGVGKSRLVAEFVARAENVRLVAIAASDAGSQAPFSILTELTQAMVGAPPGRGVDARGQLSRRLRRMLDQAGLSPGEIDECAGTLEQAMELRDGAILRSTQTSADFRDRVAAAMRRLRNVAVDRPTITVIENLHWADAASLDVLRKHTGAAATPGPELVVMTTRPRAALVPFEKDADQIVSVEELAGDRRTELIRDRLAEAESADAVQLVIARAGGNPLLIEEVCTAIRERGDDQLPASARDIMLARVDALPLQAKSALQHAAVAGPMVRGPILAELLGPETASSLATLIDESLLVSADFAAEPGDASELRFRHGLLQEAVYESLSPSARQTAHRQLGLLLAARAEAGRDERPGEVAKHLELGGELEAAARFWVRAGELALTAFDADSARQAFSRALDRCLDPPGLAAPSGRVDLGNGAAAVVIDALLGREKAFGLLGDHDAQTRDQEALVERAASRPELAAEIYLRIAVRQARTGDYQAALGSADRVAAAAADSGDDKFAGEAMLVRGEVLERTGEFVKALNAVTEATEIFHRIGDRAGEMRSLVVRGRNCLTRSRYRAARDAYEPVLDRLDREPDPFLERMVRNHLAVIDLCVGNFEPAMESARRSVTLCEELGDRARVGDNLSVCGIILCAVGQYLRADDYLGRGLAILEETQSRWSISDCKLYAGTCATLLGDYDRGLSLLESAIADARELNAPYVLANALTELAGALLRRDRSGDTIAAEAAAREAHGVARDASLVGIEILALARHAEATVRLGNTMSAVALSTRAVDLLDDQEGIEGSEEEVLYTHCQLLRRTGDERAEVYLAKARASLDSKLDRLNDPGWRESFCRDVAVNAAILLES
jgi:serine/threonine protein kinase/tetratricopeptide (TPR) repeat protein